MTPYDMTPYGSPKPGARQSTADPVEAPGELRVRQLEFAQVVGRQAGFHVCWMLPWADSGRTGKMARVITGVAGGPPSHSA